MAKNLLPPWLDSLIAPQLQGIDEMVEALIGSQLPEPAPGVIGDVTKVATKIALDAIRGELPGPRKMKKIRAYVDMILTDITEDLREWSEYPDEELDAGRYWVAGLVMRISAMVKGKSPPSADDVREAVGLPRGPIEVDVKPDARAPVPPPGLPGVTS